MFQNNNVARVFYNKFATTRTAIITCTCGCYEKVNEYNISECPNCKSKNIKIDRYFISRFSHNKKEYFTFNLIEADIKEKKFYIKKISKRTQVKDVENKYILDVISTDIYETWFDAKNPKNTIIKKNGEEISLILSHLERSLSNIDIEKTFCKKNNNIFYDYFLNINSKTTLAKMIWNFICFPQYEIIYNTYHSFKYLIGFNQKYFKEGTTPSEVMGLPKSIWNNLKYIIDLNLKENIYMVWDSVNFLVEKYKNKPDIVNKIILTASQINLHKLNNFIELFELNYNMKSLLQYLTESIYTYQGISDKNEGFQLLYDYVHMCQLMDVSFEKYPKSLKLRHDLASKNLKIVLSDKEKREMELILNKEEYKQLTYEGKEYSVIQPISAQDIIEEGKSLHHCVGSYVDLVKNRKTMILFMRDKNNLNKSLITLEVRGNVLRQYAGSSDRIPNEKEMKFIKKYCKEKHITLNENHALNYID